MFVGCICEMSGKQEKEIHRDVHETSRFAQKCVISGAASTDSWELLQLTGSNLQPCIECHVTQKFRCCDLGTVEVRRRAQRRASWLLSRSRAAAEPGRTATPRNRIQRQGGLPLA